MQPSTVPAISWELKLKVCADIWRRNNSAVFGLIWILKSLKKTILCTLNKTDTQGFSRGLWCFYKTFLNLLLIPRVTRAFLKIMISAVKKFFWIVLCSSHLHWVWQIKIIWVWLPQRTSEWSLWLTGIFMMLHRPDTEMKEAPLEGLSVLIRGHYLYAVSGSWLVTSQ